jgi:hypothetical protein
LGKIEYHHADSHTVAALRTRLSMVLLATLSAASSTLGATGAESSLAPFSVSISTRPTTVKTGSEVAIKVTITNTSGSKIEIGRSVGQNEGEMNQDLEILDNQGKRTATTSYGRRVKGEGRERGEHGEPPPPAIIGSDIFFPIEPGKSIEDIIIANKLYDLSQPGKYTIQVTRFDPYYSKTSVKSNIITLTVTP